MHHYIFGFLNFFFWKKLSCQFNILHLPIIVLDKNEVESSVSFVLINHHLQFFQHAFTPLLFLIAPLFIYFWPPYMAYGILVLWPGMELLSLAVEVPIPNHWTTQEIPNFSFWLDLYLKVASHQAISWKAFFFIICLMITKSLSHARLFVSPWTPLSMEFSRQEYCWGV